MCTGMSCHLRGATKLLDAVEQHDRHQAGRDRRRTGDSAWRPAAASAAAASGRRSSSTARTTRRMTPAKVEDVLKQYRVGRHTMTRLHSAAELEQLRAGILSARDPAKPCIAVCAGAACHGLDSAAVASAFQTEVGKLGLDAKVEVRVTGCHGFCEKGPNVVVDPDEICYFEVKPEDVPGDRRMHAEEEGGRAPGLRATRTPARKRSISSEVPFYKHQMRLLIGDNHHASIRCASTTTWRSAAMRRSPRRCSR